MKRPWNLPRNAAAPARIVVVDDDPGIRDVISDFLGRHGYEVDTAADAAELEQALAAAPVDLVVLDVMLPGEDGLAICRRLAAERRARRSSCCSAMGEETDRIVGLELGADDYLPKPCNPRELLARVRAVLRAPAARRRGGAVGAACEFAGWRLDLVRRELRSPQGVVVNLTSGEFSLLRAFVERPQRVLTRDQLLDLARGPDSDAYDRAIDVQISRLRRKLEDGAERPGPDPHHPQRRLHVHAQGRQRTMSARLGAAHRLAVRPGAGPGAGQPGGGPADHRAGASSTCRRPTPTSTGCARSPTCWAAASPPRPRVRWWRGVQRRAPRDLYSSVVRTEVERRLRRPARRRARPGRLRAAVPRQPADPHLADPAAAAHRRPAAVRADPPRAPAVRRAGHDRRRGQAGLPHRALPASGCSSPTAAGGWCEPKPLGLLDPWQQRVVIWFVLTAAGHGAGGLLVRAPPGRARSPPSPTPPSGWAAIPARRRST